MEYKCKLLKWGVIYFLCLIVPNDLSANKIDSLLIKAEKREGLVDSISASLHQTIGEKYEAAANYDSSLLHYENAIRIAKQSNTLTVLAKSYFGKGVALIGMHEMEKAKAAYLLAAKVGKGVMPDHFIAKCYANIAERYFDEGETPQAMQDLLILMEEIEKTGEPGMLYFLNSKLGLLHFRMESYDKALSYYLKARRHLESLDFDITYIRANFNSLCSIGAAYGALRQLDSTQHYLEKSLEVARANNNDFEISYALQNLSELYYDTRQPEISLQAANEAYTLFVKQKNERGMAVLLHLMGRVYLDLLDSPIKATAYLEEAGQLFKSTGLPSDLIAFNKDLASAYTALGQYEKANVLKDTIIAISQRFYEENKVKTTLDLEAKYDSKKKELEIANQKVAILENEAKIRELYIFGGIAAILLLMGILWMTAAKYRLQKNMDKALQAIAEQVKKVGSAVGSKGQVELEAANKDGKGFLQQFGHQLSPKTAQEIEAILLGMNELHSYLEQMPSEEMLQEQQVQKDKAIEDLKAFNYSVSHDLRTPLVKVKNFVDLLQNNTNQVASPQTKQYLKVINRSVEQMDEMVRDMLHYARMEHVQLYLSTVDTRSLMEEIIEGLPLPMNGHRPDFHFDNLPTIQTDQVLLKQVFANLISNAVKFSTDQPKPIIQVSSQKKGEKVVFTVKDNGIGFDQKHADLLFKLFHRMPNAKSYEGSGAGLAIVKRAVEKLGGEIWAKSELGLGSSFFIELPIHEA